MPLWLIGMMGSGKSAVGQRLSARTGSSFLDTDVMVEVEAGRSVAEVFIREGEQGFRLRDAHAIEPAVGVIDAVVATGGGAVLFESNVRSMKSSGPVVWLQPNPATLGARSADSSGRPLLRSDLLGDAAETQRLAVILEDRSQAYLAAADHVVATDHVTVDEMLLLEEEIWNAS